MKKLLTIEDLTRGLDLFGSRYHAINVFADDIQELVGWRDSGSLPPAFVPLAASGQRFQIEIATRLYELELFPDHGVVCLSESKSTPALRTVTELDTGVVTGTIAIAEQRKGSYWSEYLVLGLLVGAFLGEPAPADSKSPRWVFTLSFDRVDQRWCAYDGGLVRWMKESLLIRSSESVSGI